LDLSSVRGTLVAKQGWSREQAIRVEGDYKRFLYALARKREDDILSPPTKEVDQFWHQHILDTRKYRDDCEKVFGHYVDHTPGLTPDRQKRADDRRRQVYADYGIDNVFFDGGDSGATGGGHSHGGHGTDCHDASAGSHGCDAHGGDASDGGGGDGGGGDGGGSCGGGGCGGG
jgi:hypothetical protein